MFSPTGELQRDRGKVINEIVIEEERLEVIQKNDN